MCILLFANKSIEPPSGLFMSHLSEGLYNINIMCSEPAGTFESIFHKPSHTFEV